MYLFSLSSSWLTSHVPGVTVQSMPNMSCALRQGGEQQQGVVRAVQLECRCMQHECSRQAEAIQLLEAAADQRRMQERQQEHHFWDIAREALGKSAISLCAGMTIIACFRGCIVA